jgi:hypothetical protein
MRKLTLAVLVLAVVSAGFAQDAPAKLSGTALIDHHLKAKWDEIGLKPAKRAEDSEYLRRAYLDIVGVIPSAEEAQKFLDDKSPYKRQKLVETLLKDPRYAEHWSTVWSGILVGFDTEGRDQLARAKEQQDLEDMFAKNMRYDEFARRVITVDGAYYDRGGGFNLPEKERDHLPKEVGMVSYIVRQERIAGRQDFPLAMAGKVTRVFMGVQIQCAQCHDHPFDKWTQEEFYGMASFLTGLRPDRKYYLPEAAQEQIKKETDKRKQAELMQRLRIQYYDVRDVDEPKPAAAAPATPRERMRERFMGGQARDLTIPNSKGGPIKASFLETGKGVEAGASRRATFAKYVTEPANLQFAKMAVNRYWAQMFGAGIVNPPDDFNGRNKPTHPELLEELAKDFIAHKYDIHWLIKAIAASEAYNLSSRSATKERDPQAEKYLALARVRALMPEQILRSVIEATNLGQGPMARAMDRRDRKDGKREDKLDDKKGPMAMPDMRERMILGLVAQFRSNFGDDEGGEVAEFSGTIPAALLMMNHPQLMGMATTAMRGSGFGEALSKQTTPEDKVKYVFLTALSRPPTSKEMTRWKGHVGAGDAKGYEDLLWTLLNTSEFLFNH